MIIFWFVILVNSIRGFQDAWLRGIEHTFRDNLKEGYDLEKIDKASTSSSFAEFSTHYFWVIYALALIADNSMQFLFTLIAILVLQLFCGNEDFWHYFFEPIFQHPRRDERYKVKFLIWRLPEELYWLGEGDGQGHSGWRNPLLMLLCGRRVALKPFLAVVFISTAIVYLISIYWI